MTSLLPPANTTREIEKQIEREIVIVQQYVRRRFRLTVAAATIVAALIGAATMIGTSALQRGTRDDVAELQLLIGEHKAHLKAIESRINAIARSVDERKQAASVPVTNPVPATTTLTATTESHELSANTRTTSDLADFSGKWEWPNSFGRVRIHQKPDGSVTGEYSDGGGALTGRVVKDRLEFAWWQPDTRKGNGYVEVKRSGAGGSVTGRWCIGVTCDPDDPRQDRRIDGTTTDW